MNVAAFLMCLCIDDDLFHSHCCSCIVPSMNGAVCVSHSFYLKNLRLLKIEVVPSIWRP